MVMAGLMLQESRIRIRKRSYVAGLERMGPSYGTRML